MHYAAVFLFFFFQAEDGIRDTSVTGVQTCALPICVGRRRQETEVAPTPVLGVGEGAGQGGLHDDRHVDALTCMVRDEIGRASCRERVSRQERSGVKIKKKSNLEQ